MRHVNFKGWCFYHLLDQPLKNQVFKGHVLLKFYALSLLNLFK